MTSLSGSGVLSSWAGTEPQKTLTSSAYQVTGDGETYGTALLEETVGEMPDWICVKATNGCSGYIDADDFWTPMPVNPADAVANFSVQRVRSIPVYAEPGGGEVIGQFDMYYGGVGK